MECYLCFFGGKVGFVRVPWRFSYYFYVVISCPVQIAWICAIVILFWPHIIIIRIEIISVFFLRFCCVMSNHGTFFINALAVRVRWVEIKHFSNFA